MARAWYREPSSWLGLGALGASVLLVERQAVTEAVRDIVGRGKKLTTSSMGADGVIQNDPARLLQEASVAYGEPLPAEVYSLARMVRSEGAAQAVARVNVARNDLRKLGWRSMDYLMTYSTAGWARGQYGKQHSTREAYDDKGNLVTQSQTRRYATSKDPYELDVRNVLIALASPDTTGGAVKFVDRSGFGVQAGTGSFDALRAKWEGDGLVAYTLPQYGDDLVFFKVA